jgi:hypothetical protein
MNRPGGRTGGKIRINTSNLYAVVLINDTFADSKNERI